MRHNDETAVRSPFLVGNVISRRTRPKTRANVAVLARNGGEGGRERLRCGQRELLPLLPISTHTPVSCGAGQAPWRRWWGWGPRWGGPCRSGHCPYPPLPGAALQRGCKVSPRSLADAGSRLWAGSGLGASQSPPGAWCDVSGGAPEAEEEIDNSHLWGVPPALPTPRHTVGREMFVCVHVCGGAGVGVGEMLRGVLTEPRALVLSLICTVNHLPFFF